MDRYLSISAMLKQRAAEEKAETELRARENRTTYSRRAAAVAVKSLSEKDLAKAAADTSTTTQADSDPLTSSLTKMGRIANGLCDLCSSVAESKLETPGSLKRLEEKIESAGHWNSLNMMKEVIQDAESMFYDALTSSKKVHESNEGASPSSPDDNVFNDDYKLQAKSALLKDDLEWMESSSQDEDVTRRSSVTNGQGDNVHLRTMWWSNSERKAWSQHLSDAQTIAAVAYSASILDDRVRLALDKCMSKSKGDKGRRLKRKRN
mmetsp:Transcript_507/g.3667  ORF Transcript_507/g.3667 Transcript_507/m.3667 type:complete len:264 (-) Transcript_507:470-1261(-)